MIPPKATQPPATNSLLLLLLLRLLHHTRLLPPLRLGVQGLYGRLRDGGLGVRGQPGREGAALFGVVVAQDAAHVGVVFGVAIGLGGEEAGLEVGDLGGGFSEEVRVPGRHGGWCCCVCWYSLVLAGWE